MADRADNQARLQDVDAGPGEGAFKQLFLASGGANAERIDVDKAAELGILDKTRAEALRASALDDEFKRVYAAEKAGNATERVRRTPVKVFIDAFNAVYGKPRFEQVAASEKKGNLVAVMAKVLRQKEGLTGEGANFTGHDELRVMACAMDDMSLEHAEAMAKVPDLRVRKAEQEALRDELTPKQQKLEAAKDSHKDLFAPQAHPEAFIKDLKAAAEALKDAKGKRNAAVYEQGLIASEGKRAKEIATTWLKKVDNFKKVLQRFKDVLEDRKYPELQKAVADFGRKVDTFKLDADSFDYKAFADLLKKDLAELITNIDATPLAVSPVVDADGRPFPVFSNRPLLRQFGIFKQEAAKLVQVAEAVSAYHDSLSDTENQADAVDEGGRDVMDKTSHLVGAKLSSLKHLRGLVPAVAAVKDDQNVKDLLPEIAGECEGFHEALNNFVAQDASQIEVEELAKFVEIDLRQFLTSVADGFNRLSAAQGNKLSEIEGKLAAVDVELERLEAAMEGGDPEKRILRAAFPGMEIGEDGKIKVKGFEGDTARVMEKFDGEKNKAGNVVSVGAIPWLEDSKNLGGIESEMTELGGLVDRINSDQFVAVLRANGIDVQGNGGNLQFPPVSKMRGKLEEKITALRGNMISDPNDRVIAAGVEKARARFEAEKERKVSAARAAWEEVKAPFNRREVLKEREGLQYGKNAKQDRLNDNRINKGAWKEEQKFKLEKAEKEKALRDAQAETFNEEAAAEAIVGPAQKRRSEQAEKLGELGEALQILKKIEELTAKLAPKCKELVGHLSVGNKAGVFEKAGLQFKEGDADADFEAVEGKLKALDPGKPQTFLDFHAMFGGYFADENKVGALVGEYKGVRETILAMTSMEKGAAAKRVVAEILREQGVPEAQINDRATAVVRDGVGIMATKKSWLQVAREAQPKALENLKALAFRDKLVKFKLKKGEKETTPFAGLKPENFVDPKDPQSTKAIEQTLKTLEKTKGKDWVLEHGFYILAFFKVSEGVQSNGKQKVDASLQGVYLEKHLKNMLAEKRLELHPEFATVDEAMFNSEFVKLIEGEFVKMSEHGSLKFGEFSDAYDANFKGMKMRLALKIDRDLKILKAKRKAKMIGSKQYNQEFTALLEKAEEEGVRGMLKEVSPRLAVGKAAFMSGMWNSDFMVGAREKGRNAADWLKAKGAALGATTLGGAITGSWQFMKRLTFGGAIGSVMAPIGVIGWFASGITNLVLGRWKFASTREMFKSDVKTAWGFVSGGVGKAMTDTTAKIKTMWQTVKEKKSDEAKAKRKEKADQALKLAESDTEALKGKTELDAVEVPDDPYKDIAAGFEKLHKALAERKKPDSMRQARPGSEPERLAA
ncbi:hypothetical protein HY604_02620 [Candidatus Peregrinibacteria bacterium]|nr:hypothetical protein [Candidatus Peregrinibacteria bacterium]